MQKGKESRIKKRRKTSETGRRHNIGKKITLRSSSNFQKFDTFSAQRDEFLHQNLSKGRHEWESSSNEQSKAQGLVLTLLEELVGRWVSREPLASVTFFRCLEPREEETLLVGASGDFTTGVASWKEGSSAAVASTEGAMAASLFGFSLSLQRKQKVNTLHKSKESQHKTKFQSQYRLTSPRGQKFQDHQWEQKVPRPQLWKQRYSRRQVPRHASSSYQD
jgi:hypothetical protein